MMAYPAEDLKGEAIKPASKAINHPYSKRSANPLASLGLKKAAEVLEKHPGLPYEKLLVIAELLK